MVLGTVLLIAALYFIGKRQHLFSNTIALYCNFKDVKGLQLGNNVRYSGINVGTVSKIKMIGEDKITVEMKVDQKTGSFIKNNALASINSDGLVGSMVVNIIPGGKAGTKVVVTGDTIQSQRKTSTDQMLSTLDTTNRNAAMLTSDLLKITNEIVEGKGTLGTLVNDTVLANDIRKTVAELRKTSQNTSAAVARINRIVAKVNYDESAAAVLLSDTTAASQAKSMFANFEASSENIKKTTKNLDAYIEELKSGKGAVHRLTQDEELIENIDSTVINIKNATEKLDQNMEALKHNFLFRGYFRKLERQKKRAAKKD